MAVQSIERAFAILRALATGPSGVTELAERVGLPKSTVARLLSALEEQRAIEQTQTGGEYRLGPGIEEIAGGSPQGRSLIAAAQPFLTDLTEQTQETAGLDTLVEGRIHFMDLAEADQDVQIRDWSGEHGPPHSLSAGLAILAHSPDEVVAEILERPLDAMTPATLRTPAELLERLAQARSAGYAWVFEEFAEGINSVAAPVFGPDGVVAALRIHGPSYRFPDPDRTHDIGLIVMEAAALLSEQLQAFGP